MNLTNLKKLLQSKTARTVFFSSVAVLVFVVVFIKEFLFGSKTTKDELLVNDENNPHSPEEGLAYSYLTDHDQGR